MAENKDPQQQLELALRAAQGNRQAQQAVNDIAQPVIDFQTSRFCQRFCRENRYLYRCSLSQPIGGASAGAALCEWGNASYGWMLDDLCSPKRLQKYEGRNQASLFDYLYSIANSLPFYERWKDWRFGRRQHVPTYIRELGDQATAVFYAMRGNQPVAQIAQTTGLGATEAETLASEIVLQLTRRHKLYLLDPPQEVSLSLVGAGGDEETMHQRDIPVDDDEVESQEQRDHLRQAWSKLDAVEQFVLEAMIIEEQDADDVLQALQTLDVSIKPGVDAKQTNRQQLYYFKRKALSRLGLALID
ncbi:MAG: hypothetical protein GY935_21455 [Gammaproteobacteria bacterium]|nr:hypothetical protein [Gammaproteobacteria bacterium]